MKKIEIVRNPPPERKIVAYRHKDIGAIYILGVKGEGGGHYTKQGDWVPYTWSESAFTGLSDYYTPLYSGDQIIISEVITL